MEFLNQAPINNPLNQNPPYHNISLSRNSVRKLLRHPIFLILFFFATGFMLGNYYGSKNNLYIPAQVISVVGNGRIKVPADEVLVNITIVTQAKTEKEAAEKNKTVAQDFGDKLLALGVPQESIRVNSYAEKPYSSYDSSYDLTPIPSPRPNLQDSRTLGEKFKLPPPYSDTYDEDSYTSTTNFEVILNNPSLVDKIESLANETPSARFGESIYVLKDSTPYEGRVREVALLDAKKQVEEIAKINNIRIDKVVSVVDLDRQPSVYGSNQYYNTTYDKRIESEYGEKEIYVTARYEVKYQMHNKILSIF